jgi:hypothetical protein
MKKVFANLSLSLPYYSVVLSQLKSRAIIPLILILESRNSVHIHVGQKVVSFSDRNGRGKYNIYYLTFLIRVQTEYTRQSQCYNYTNHSGKFKEYFVHFYQCLN